MTLAITLLFLGKYLNTFLYALIVVSNSIVTLDIILLFALIAYINSATTLLFPLIAYINFATTLLFPFNNVLNNFAIALAITLLCDFKATKHV